MIPFAAVFLYRDLQAGELASSTTTKATTTTINDDPLVSLDNGNTNTRPDAAGKKQGRRDERRRATHNEVERRRRDKINNWIMKLGSIIPDTCEAPSKHGPVDGLSKGGILAAACEYIGELKEENENLTRHKLEVSTLCETSQYLVEENGRLQQENRELREILLRHGIQFECAHVVITKEEEAGEGSDVVLVQVSS